MKSSVDHPVVIDRCELISDGRASPLLRILLTARSLVVSKMVWINYIDECARYCCG